MHKPRKKARTHSASASKLFHHIVTAPPCAGRQKPAGRSRAARRKHAPRVIIPRVPPPAARGRHPNFRKRLQKNSFVMSRQHVKQGYRCDPGTKNQREHTQLALSAASHITCLATCLIVRKCRHAPLNGARLSAIRGKQGGACKTLLSRQISPAQRQAKGPGAATPPQS